MNNEVKDLLQKYKDIIELQSKFLTAQIQGGDTDNE